MLLFAFGVTFELGVGGPEPGDLGFGEHVHLGLLEPGPVAVLDGVALDEPPADGPLEHDL